MVALILFALLVAPTSPIRGDDQNVRIAFETAHPAVPPPPSSPSLTLSATNGTVGSTVAASGTGFAANSTITYTFAGLGVAESSPCTTDSNGNFPGSSGTNCTFTIPAAPGGSEVVAAVGGTSTVGVAVSAKPSDLAYDSGTGQTFVLNSGSDNVEVVSDTLNTVVATVGVGSDPYSAAYDSSTGQIFVANEGSNNVSVISDTTDTVVATVTVGSAPYGIVYDSTVGEIFVVNHGGDNVSVISDTSDTVVAGIGVGSDPYRAAYDFRTDEVFVSNYGSNNVSVLSDSTDTVVATVAVGKGPVGLAYDAGTNQVFVTNFGSDNVSVVSGTADVAVASVPVGLGPYAAAYDPGTAEIFVANYDTNNVSRIAEATDLVVGTVRVGTGPWGVAYDSGTGNMMVANFVSDNLSIIAIGEATAQVRLYPGLALATTTGSADVGQTVTLRGSGFGSLLSITSFTLGSFSIACSGATNGTCVGGALVANIDGSFAAQFTVPPLGTSGAYPVVVTDSSGNSGTASITFDTDPTASTPTATPGTIDLGQSTRLSVLAAFGSGVYRYSWSGFPRGCSGAVPLITCSPEAAGNYSVSVRV
ncbi:MAG: YncE family protein, partial [Thermoplasmata archaeon]|nr:YncE family protein [Thermoplasmata archaeon]